MNDLKCLFCLKIDADENLAAAGTLHAKEKKVVPTHVRQFTETIKEKALKMGKTRILAHLAVGDVKTNQVYYHKVCLTSFNNEYVSAIRRE